MAVTYNKLWHLLIDRGMKKKDLKEFRKKAQLIFQNPYMSLNPRMKIYDILKEPFIVHKIKDYDDAIKKIIKLIVLPLLHLLLMYFECKRHFI